MKVLDVSWLYYPFGDLESQRELKKSECIFLLYSGGSTVDIIRGTVNKQEKDLEGDIRQLHSIAYPEEVNVI